eukprot:TRINITY_DN4861_c0_g1_i1.p2 TRINITY_DN4861_c0_g1~~TRINITY_DN4861_c0_g1_i1.p2  ORF type:complete len:71 (+),score=17.44 TRINITY_DN4861_c0_g1_i1:351-563(+)
MFWKKRVKKSNEEYHQKIWTRYGFSANSDRIESLLNICFFITISYRAIIDPIPDLKITKKKKVPTAWPLV